MVGAWGGIERNPRLITVVPCVAATLGTDECREALNDRLSHTELVEDLAGAAMTVQRGASSRCSVPTKLCPRVSASAVARTTVRRARGVRACSARVIPHARAAPYVDPR